MEQLANATPVINETPAVVTRGLCRNFGKVTALRNVDLDVRPGTVLGLLGPNGSGKTTLLSILAGFVSPDSGSFQLLGESDHRAALARTGSLISRPLLWPHMTCRDNLRCVQAIAGGGSDPDEVERLLAEVGLDGNAAHRKFGQCSTGMKQRLGIATALLGSPDLLLLDEPTTGLDPEGMVEMRELVRSLGKTSGRTIIMSSHLLHEVELTCDHYAIIFRGNLADQGPMTAPETPASQVQVGTTNNLEAVSVLEANGWTILGGPTPSEAPGAVPDTVMVGAEAGEEWKISRDLAEKGIYPILMRPSDPEKSSAGLEQKYLAAVGRIESPQSGGTS